MTALDTIRRASALMRERAVVATVAAMPWEADEIGVIWTQEADGQPVLIANRATDEDAAHIAAADPTTMLAVTDWLASVADRYVHMNETGAILGGTDWEAALTVARRYLREDS